MKRLLLGFVLIASVSSADGPVTGNASFVAWDYDVTGSVADEFRLYCAASSGVAPTGPPTATILVPSLQWPISGMSGQQYCVVTAFDSDAGVESSPSNEIPFFVLPAPGNARVVVP